MASSGNHGEFRKTIAKRSAVALGRKVAFGLSVDETRNKVKQKHVKM
jgi:hypothetical protein